MKILATLACDGYKLAHREMYQKGITKVYSTWTARSNKHMPSVDGVLAFGFQGAVKEIVELFDNQFFNRPKDEVITEYRKHVSSYLFNPNVETKHLEDLHDLGYLPIEIKALEEGTLVPFRVPMLTIENTKPEYFWITNYLETILSCLLWKPSTSATIAREYRKILDKFAIETTGSIAGVEFQGHDFSMRGQSGPEDSARTGVGHLLSFVGTDTLPAILYAEQYYNADVTKELVGCSVSASEHSIMSAGSKEGEFETYRRLIEDVHPTGIVSIVSDTWDLWHVITDTLPKLKDKIMARDGGPESLDKVVIRPDSGDPVDILCGTLKKPIPKFGIDTDFSVIKSRFEKKAESEVKSYYFYYCDKLFVTKGRFHSGSYETYSQTEETTLAPAHKGVVELLWDIFGGTVNEKGYKVLDSHIGAIYGDAITPERCDEICKRLAAKGFASTNVVFGIGSYTYQYITRDSLGFAMKATSVTIDGKEQAIFKDPITDDGTKKSAKGRVVVLEDDENGIHYVDSSMHNKTELEVLAQSNLLTTVFENGKLVREVTLSEVRENVKKS